MNNSLRKKITLSSIASILGIISFVLMIVPYLEPQSFGVELVIISSFDSEYDELNTEYMSHILPSVEKTILKNKLDKMEEIRNLTNHGYYDSAEKRIDEILSMEEYQNDGTFLVAKIEVMLHQGKDDEAVKYFDVLKNRDNVLNKILNDNKILFILNNIGVNQVLNEDYKGAEKSFKDLQEILETSGNLSSETVTMKNEKKYPIYTIAVNNLSIAMNKLENYNGAKKELQGLIAKGIANHMTYNNLAITYLKLNNFENAEKSINKALGLDPGNKMLLQNKEKVIQQKSAEERYIHPQIELTEETVQVEHTKNLGPKTKASSHTCNIEDADDKIIRANIEANSRNYIEAERIYKEILDCEPDNVKAKVGLAYVYTERSRVGEAEKLYFEVLLVEPDNPTTKTGHGYLLSQTNRLDEAEEICNSMIMEDWEHYPAHNCLGEVYKNKKDYESAETAYENSIKINNEKNKAYNGLGFVHLVLGEIDESLKNYHMSLDDNGDDPDALFGLGVGYLIKGDTIASQGYFNRLIASELFSVEELIEMADIMTEEKNHEWGHKIYIMTEEMKLTDEQKNRTTNGQANYHLQRGNLLEAEKLYMETLSRDHEDFNALMGMCHVKQENEEYSLAGDYRKLAIAADPDNHRLEVECLVSTE